LRCLQPDLEGTEMLDSAFDHMIDAQIEAATQESAHVRKKRARQRVCQAIPDVLSAAGARVVVVYGEAAPLRAGDPQPWPPMRLSAAVLDGDAVFDRMVQTRNAPSAMQAAHLELGLHDLDTAQPLDDVIGAFQAFCEGSSGEAPTVLVSWGVWTHRWLQATMGDVPCILLKGVWANVSRTRVPDLDELVTELGITAPELSLRGRSERRLSHAYAMTRHILSGVANAQ